MDDDRRIKKLTIVAFVIAIIGLTIAYLAMSTVFEIVKAPNLTKRKHHNIYFENLRIVETSKDADFITKPSIDKYDKTTINDFKVKLTKPKDYVVFEVDVVNNGTKSASIADIIVPFKNNRNYTIKCRSSVGSESDEKLVCGTKGGIPSIRASYTYIDGTLKLGSILEPQEKKTLRGVVYYDEAATELPSGSMEVYGLGMRITYR